MWSFHFLLSNDTTTVSKPFVLLVTLFWTWIVVFGVHAMERWMISCDFTILQAPPSDGNVSVHATKAAKSVVGFSHRFTICESKFGSLRLKSLDVLGSLRLYSPLGSICSMHPLILALVTVPVVVCSRAQWHGFSWKTWGKLACTTVSRQRGEFWGKDQRVSFNSSIGINWWTVSFLINIYCIPFIRYTGIP